MQKRNERIRPFLFRMILHRCRDFARSKTTSGQNRRRMQQHTFVLSAIVIPRFLYRFSSIIFIIPLPVNPLMR